MCYEKPFKRINKKKKKERDEDYEYIINVYI